MSAETATALLGRGRAALRQGALDEALALLEGAHARLAPTDSPALEPEVLVELARCLRARGTFEQAILCVERAQETARARGALALEAEACLVEADLLALFGDHARAQARRADAARLAASSPREAVGGREGGRRDRTLLEAFLQISRRLVDERDPDRILAAVLDGAVEAAGAERGFVLLAPHADEGAEGEDKAASRRELPGELAVAAARNFDRLEVRRPEFVISRTVIDKALATKAPVIVRDASVDAELSERTSVVKHKLRSIVCLPFESSRPGGVSGVLYFDNRFAYGTFDPADLPAFAAFAAHAAVAVENARLHARSGRQERALDRARARAEELARRLEAELARAGDELERVRARLEDTESRAGGRAGYSGIVGASNAMQEVYRILEKVKDVDVPVLVLGESGTGKELVARAIHQESRRRAEPFVSENCAAIPESLLESTLFGHEAGAFTGAAARRAGLFELAGAGTIFLDEVGELAPAFQAKLLRVLQEWRVRRVGGSEEVPIRARVIAATNRDLALMVRDGRFREDLYYRLNVVSVRLPALRERRDDIPSLLQSLFAKLGAPVPRFAPDALRALLDHAWPGNVRELDNEVRRLHALSGERVSREDLSPGILGLAGAVAPRGGDAVVTFKEGERRTLVAALRAARGDRVKAAELLAMPHGTLWHKVKKHRIDESEYL